MSDDQTEKLREVLVDIAQMELAGVKAGIEFWTAWIEVATKFAEDVGGVLSKVAAGEQTNLDFIGDLADSSRKYLRQMTELPQHAADRFNKELERRPRSSITGTPARKPAARRPVRRTRAKR